MLRIVIHGNPVPKGRPRLGGSRQVYTPEKTLYYENSIGMAALIAMSEQQVDCFNEPIMISMIFYRSTKQRCDLDNLIKSVLDGLNQVAYADDVLVHKISAEKRYDKIDGRVEIEIERLHAKD